MEAVRATRLEIRDMLLLPLSQADLIELSGAMDEEELRERLTYYHAPSMISHLRRQLAADGVRGELTWAVYREGKPLGICGLWPFDPGASLNLYDWKPGVEMVIYLNRKGRGSGTAGLIGAVLFERAEVMQVSLMATIAEDNPRSLSFSHRAWPGAERRACRERMRDGSQRDIEVLRIENPPRIEELTKAEKASISNRL